MISMKNYPKPPQPAPNWKISAEDIEKRAEKVMKLTQKADDEIANVQTPTFENTFKRYAQTENITGPDELIAGFYQHISPDKSLREASANAEEKMSAFAIQAGTREDVFSSLTNAMKQLPNSLDAESERYAKKLERKYNRNGLSLPRDVREKVVELRKELSNLQIQFAKQLAEENGFIEFTRDDLEGLSADMLEQYEKTEEGKFKMTFKYPDIEPVFKYAKNQETRKKAWIGFDERATSFNKSLVKRAVILRADIAKLMGYNNHADFVLEERMAKKSETVHDFLHDLLDKTLPKGVEERTVLINLKNKDLMNRGLSTQNVLYPWDFAFYKNYLLETDYQVDAQRIAEYFPTEQTIEKMFGIFSRLFGLDFIKQPTDEISTWHKEVEQFQVWDQSTSKFIGWLYLDLHPRDGKYGHAANFSLVKRYTDLNNGQENYPVTALVCNFSKSTPSRPSLLKHHEVTTFFHELGHGIHDLVGQSKYSAFSGTSVDWDFVEAPSQMLEYWTWSKNELLELSGHYKDGSPLPETMVDSLIRSKHVLQALFTLRQLSLGIFDLILHTKSPKDARELDIDNLWNTVREDICLYYNGGVQTSGYSAFGHIMGGYDSGYYGYMWSQVFACDMYFSKFAKDPTDSAVGMEYRDKVIGRGGSRDQNESLVDFLGREPNNEAFLKELGISV